MTSIRFKVYGNTLIDLQEVVAVYFDKYRTAFVTLRGGGQLTLCPGDSGPRRVFEDLKVYWNVLGC